MMVIQWPHRNWNTKNTHLLRCLLSFRNFHKPYQVLELIYFTMYLSQRAKNHMFENLKLGIMTVQESGTYVRNTIYKFWRNFIRSWVSYNNLKMNSKQCPKMALGGSRAKDNNRLSAYCSILSRFKSQV